MNLLRTLYAALGQPDFYALSLGRGPALLTSAWSFPAGRRDSQSRHRDGAADA